MGHASVINSAERDTRAAASDSELASLALNDVVSLAFQVDDLCVCVFACVCVCVCVFVCVCYVTPLTFAFSNGG